MQSLKERFLALSIKQGALVVAGAFWGFVALVSIITGSAKIPFFIAGCLTGLVSLLSGVISVGCLSSGNSGHTAGLGNGLVGILFGAICAFTGFIALTCFGVAGISLF